MKLQIGNKRKFGTYNANTLFDMNDTAIAMIYGIASNYTLEECGDRDAEGLANAREIAQAVNSYPEFLDAILQINRLANLPADGSVLIEGETDDPIALLLKIAEISNDAILGE